MLKILLSTLIPLTLMCADSSLDLRVSVDPVNAKARSHIDIISQTSFETDLCSFLINPEIDFYLNKSVDFGLSLGHRWDIGKGILGHHLFFDRSQQPAMSANQLGTGFDFLTPRIDLRANYYHPISKPIQWKSNLVKPCKWMEWEAMLKFPYICVGVGPHYNFDNSILGAQAKIVVPFPYFSIGLGASTDQLGNHQGFLLTSFHLYKNSSGKTAHMTASHSKRPKLEFIPIRIKREKPPVEEIAEPKPDVVPITPPEEIEKVLNDLEEAEKKVQEEIKKEEDEAEKSFDDSVREYWENRRRQEANENRTPAPSEPRGFFGTIYDFFFGTQGS